LTEQEPTEGQSRELLVALRDDSGAILAREADTLSHGGHTVPALLKMTFGLSPEDLGRLARIDIAISGTTERHESLGRFELVEPH
jgi:hypothetical protein